MGRDGDGEAWSFRVLHALRDSGFRDTSFESFGSILYLRQYVQAGIHMQDVRATPGRQIRQEKVAW